MLAHDELKLACVLTPANGSVHFIDTERLERTHTLRVSDVATGIQFTSDRKGLLVTSSKPNELAVIDLAARRVARRFKLPSEPTDMDVVLDSKANTTWTAISHGASGTVTLIDLTNGTTAHIATGPSASKLRFRSDGQLLLVANTQDRLLSAFDTKTRQRVADLPLAMRPENLCFNPDRGQLFITGEGMDAVAIIFPYRVLQVEQTVLAGRAPSAMASLTKAGTTPSYLFLASASASDLSILDIRSRRVIAVTQVGQGPCAILVTPDDQYALALNEISGDVAVIRIPVIRGNRSKTGASLFTMIPVGEKPVSGAIITTRA